MDLKRLLSWLGLSVVIAWMAPACIYDPDDRCGPNQALVAGNNRCECVAGFVPSPSGCVPCGENELESAGACVCEEGYARPSDDVACELIPEALGADCDPESRPCAEGPYAMCHVVVGTSGYCTNGCSSSDDCQGGYKCHVDGDNSYCRRPAVGYGDSCDSDADCADGEATFCEVLQSHVCLVPCSADTTDVCFEDEVCCNFVLFNPICVPSDSCSTEGGIELGAN